MDELICKVAKNVEEAKTLVDTGFDHVCDMDDVKLFGRRK